MRRIKSFLPSALAHQASSKPRHGPFRAANGLMLQGVVTKVYRPLDPELATRRSPAKLATPTVTCDVLVYNQETHTLLRDVPIMRQSAGLVDSEVWVPRAASIDLSQGDLVLDAQGPIGVTIIPPSNPNNMDGDHVIIGFLDNDLAQPIILGQIDHPRNIRNPLFADVEKFKLKRIVRGWTFGVTETGNVKLNGALASAGVVTPTIPPVETPLVGPDPLGGNLVVELAPLTKVVIKDAVAPTEQAVILGVSFLTNLNLALIDMNAKLFGLGVVSDKTTTLTAQITVALAADGLPYLASHLDTD